MSSHPAPARCVLLSGTSGTGKTTLCRMGYSAKMAAWGHPAAAIDLDTLYQAIDPLWELEYSDERNAMVLEQAVRWVDSLVDHGWQTVIVTGNSLFDPYDTAPVIAALGDHLEVHHVTLHVRVDVILARCQGQPDRDPAQLAGDYTPDSRRQHPGTALLDTSELNIAESLDALVRLVDGGTAIVSRPLRPKRLDAP